MKAHCEMIDACLPPYGLHFSGRFEHWVTICGWVIFYQLRILWVFCDFSPEAGIGSGLVRCAL
jgi:hypothetical protein